MYLLGFHMYGAKICLYAEKKEDFKQKYEFIMVNTQSILLPNSFLVIPLPSMPFTSLSHAHTHTL